MVRNLVVGENVLPLAFLVVSLLILGSQIPANAHIAFRR